MAEEVTYVMLSGRELYESHCTDKAVGWKLLDCGVNIRS